MNLRDGCTGVRGADPPNLTRQYDFLESIIAAALAVQLPLISRTLTCALNYHAISCLHSHAGRFRPCDVDVRSFTPPAHYRVPTLVDDFVNEVNRRWETANPVRLASYCLWRLNYIHPFINGNGRTARALCYCALTLSDGELTEVERNARAALTPDDVELGE